MKNVEEEDCDTHNVEKEIFFIGCEEMASTALTVKEETYSEESSEMNMCALDNTIDTVLINLNASVPYPFKEEGQECVKDSGTSFCLFGIKMEEPDHYESEASSANSETKYSSVIYDHERQCNMVDQYLEGKLPMKLSNPSCIKIKVECEEDIDSCKSGFQTNNMSVTIDMNKKCDFRSMVHGCDMGHSSNEFIRGIECQEYPILRLKEEGEEKTDKPIEVNNRNSVKIEEKENQDGTCVCSASADLECNRVEYPHLREYTNMEGNEFPTESSSIKMENKEETCFCGLDHLSTENIYMNKTLESNSGSTSHPVDSDKENSCDEKSQSINKDVEVDPERNVVQIYPNTTLDETLINDHCVDRTEGLDIQFESICDVSEFDIKDEKTFEPSLNSENVGQLDDKPPTFEPLSVILKDEPVELDGTCENKVAKNSSHVVNSRRVMLKEARVILERVSLQEVCPSLQTEALAFSETRRSSRTRMKSMKFEKLWTEKPRDHQKHLNRLNRESVLKTQTKCGLPGTFQKHTESNKCDSCKKSFRRRSDLERHKRTHTGEKTFSCDVCRSSFRQKGNLKTHLRIHSGEKPFSCRVCEASFRKSSHLKVHALIHTSEKTFTCDVCEASFRNKEYLKIHMRFHTGEKPFSCGTCHASFIQNGGLKRHLRIHTGEKPFVCGVCRSSFRGKANLKVHLRIHTGEKPFLCRTCNASFSQSSNLKVHLRIHTGEKPYVCDVCQVSFRVKGDLKVHMRSHTGEKPFLCRTCNASFSQSSNLKVHLKTHTGE